MSDIHPIFADCCAKEDSRYAMQSPWIAGGYRYATDGRIIVREATTEPDTSHETNRRSPDPTQLGWNKARLVELKLPTSIPDPMLVKCLDCMNWPKKERQHCETCNGTETILEYNPYLYSFDRRHQARVAAIGAHYLRILIRHNVKSIERVSDQMFRFRLGGTVFPLGIIRGGIVGLVMGCNPGSATEGYIRDGKIIEPEPAKP